MLNYFVVGKSVPRVDAIEKVTGKAVYGDDLIFPNLLYGKVLRSKFAHAKILHIDTSDAEKFPGVRAVVTGKEFTTNFNNPLVGNPLADQPFLAVEKVRYIGESIAVVAAISPQIAEDALSLIRVEYEQLPAVLNVEDALKHDKLLVHENFNNFRYAPGFKPIENSNICRYIEISNGNIEQGFKKADFIFEDIFTTHSTQHVPMECHVAIAQFNPDDRITIWAPDQSPYQVQNLVAAALEIPESKVRFITPPYIGGGFGGKLNLSGLMPIIPIAWKTKHRPVKIVFTREEEFVSTTRRHSSIIKLKTGVKKDGTIISRYAKLMFDTGAYADIGPIVLGKATAGSLGPYKIPNVKVEGYCVYTNKTIAGAYRGFGIPQVCWAYESQMDIIANKLGINPVDIRLKNIVEEGYITPTEKQEAHAVGLGKCLIKVKENMSQKQEGEIIENRKRGNGIACGYKTSKTLSGANALVKLNSDASADIFVSSVEVGQGVNTIFAQIVAEELSIPFNNIRILPADTNVTPFFSAVNASRTTFFLGNAVKKAAQDIKEQLSKIAKDILKADKEDLALEYGSFFVKKDPERKVKITEIMKKTYPGGINILGRGTFYHYKLGSFPSHVKMKMAPKEVWMYASHGVEIEVDIETGRIKILKVVAAHDVGKAINPVTCEGQIEGGVLQAISNTMFEELLFNKKGKILNSSLLDYKIPSASDIPEINAILVEEAHREGPYGAKGLGEMVAVPTAPAIANAIYDAVGIRIKDLPITPDKLLRALKNKYGD